MAIRVFNYNTLERVHSFEAHSDYIRSIAVHPTQPFILTSSGECHSLSIPNWSPGELSKTSQTIMSENVLCHVRLDLQLNWWLFSVWRIFHNGHFEIYFSSVIGCQTKCLIKSSVIKLHFLWQKMITFSFVYSKKTHKNEVIPICCDQFW